eukprot:GEZU01019002.1.p1 GENE.GEZU01019002.1~~GEZU01019002.1.p1  ORF type:complete len:175 (+),score=12.40 GEZU01019002.1:728-1252(+)
MSRGSEYAIGVFEYRASRSNLSKPWWPISWPPWSQKQRPLLLYLLEPSLFSKLSANETTTATITAPEADTHSFSGCDNCHHQNRHHRRHHVIISNNYFACGSRGNHIHHLLCNNTYNYNSSSNNITNTKIHSSSNGISSGSYGGGRNGVYIHAQSISFITCDSLCCLTGRCGRA